MQEPMINPAIVQYGAQYRAAELEREWKHRRDIPQPRTRRLPAIDWSALAAAAKTWLFPAPPFGADRQLRAEAVPYRLR